MKRQLKKWKLVVAATSMIMTIGFLIACQEKTAYYTVNDFESIPKTDVHLHIDTQNPIYMEFASKHNFRVISPNVDAGTSIEDQFSVSEITKKEWTDQYAFLGTFSVESFNDSNFADNTIDRIKQCLIAGASGIKIWKNIGMELKDTNGQFIMIDNPIFDPIFNYLEVNKIPVMGHLGEPLDCWLPLDEMINAENRRYYENHPQYHMYMHPESPSYDDQINARDNRLRNNPNLLFTGAHIASLEWSVDEVAKRLDEFPNMNIDLSARMTHIQYQSVDDYEKVKNFFIKYQDRILYGTDITINANQANPNEVLQRLQESWKSHWIYLVTDSTQHIKSMQQNVKGLKLPKEVIDKIYNNNADRFFESI